MKTSVIKEESGKKTVYKRSRISFTKTRVENIIFNTLNIAFMCVLAIATLYPFWNTIVISFNQAIDTLRGGIYVWPRAWSLQNYNAVFATGTVFQAFLISVARTVIAVITNLLLTTMLAYALSRKEFIIRKPITTIIVLTMYVNAGIIPGYMLIKSLGLLNNFLVYVIPGMLSAFNFIVIRTYIHSIPEAIIESARMDGAGDFRILFQLIFPLCRPVLATIALFVAVGAWNSWFDTFLYASSKQYLSTLQFELMKLLSASMNQSRTAADIGAAGMMGDASYSVVTPLAIRAAITVVAAVPILIVYPFLQRHFIAGLNVGGVKE
jgi:putative aldouronate transport system permease protein